ncbi:uncharacterized protein BJ171DRAFT_310316 [Polychytrium aggregatum]|uniref:uncharacterized protein n=1 Tax=Polychytrium aggregatum TaxID=110093 RepID=UPI0022FEBB5D|nr:uncharacterized protein BJ171DRAFT_310316 [Polychytrium aggregatum]KAI9207018.1 hypothetical protein BJ171DRAFT_310316 [Polychytrium aggregatum]
MAQPPQPQPRSQQTSAQKHQQSQRQSTATTEPAAAGSIAPAARSQKLPEVPSDRSTLFGFPRGWIPQGGLVIPQPPPQAYPLDEPPATSGDMQSRILAKYQIGKVRPTARRGYGLSVFNSASLMVGFVIASVVLANAYNVYEKESRILNMKRYLQELKEENLALRDLLVLRRSESK